MAISELRTDIFVCSWNIWKHSLFMRLNFFWVPRMHSDCWLFYIFILASLLLGGREFRLQLIQFTQRPITSVLFRPFEEAKTKRGAWIHKNIVENGCIHFTKEIITKLFTASAENVEKYESNDDGEKFVCLGDGEARTRGGGKNNKIEWEEIQLGSFLIAYVFCTLSVWVCVWNIQV